MAVFNAYIQSLQVTIKTNLLAELTPSLFYLGYTVVPHSIPSRPNQRPINVEYLQAQHPSRASQSRAFTSDSIQALVTP